MSLGNLKYFAVAALIAMAPMTAMAGSSYGSQKDKNSYGSSRSILLKKSVITHSIWNVSFDHGKSKSSKNKQAKTLVKYAKFFVGHYNRPKTPKPYCPPSETPIPEPTAALLFATGAGVVALRIRRGRR